MSHTSAAELRTIVDQLVAARQRQRLHQTDLAALMGVSYTALSMWESGAVMPTGLKLAAWAEHLGYALTLTRREEP